MASNQHPDKKGRGSFGKVLTNPYDSHRIHRSFLKLLGVSSHKMFIPTFLQVFHPETPGCTQKKTACGPPVIQILPKRPETVAPKTQVMLYGKGAVSPEGESFFRFAASSKSEKLTVFRMPNIKVTMEKPTMNEDVSPIKKVVAILVYWRTASLNWDQQAT